eukprot:CAMPEP_0175022472 /NCGR_PEP_ID=MMETSP0005-20121125/15333_1 /TAXON_ID=420556 /ORGANISM="Ochromonas sp., Strain CCMP1393" /LENGTH=84 /DNA_ID=CAMNT_0016280723 /DNA_START=57 /DNA_END=311 /DNA_ORIENTATION=+
MTNNHRGCCWDTEPPILPWLPPHHSTSMRSTGVLTQSAPIGQNRAEEGRYEDGGEEEEEEEEEEEVAVPVIVVHSPNSGLFVNW